MKRLVSGMEECTRCKYRGAFKEGSMDEINSFKKSLKSGITPAAPREINTGTTNAQLKAKLKSLKGTKTDDFEII